MASERSSDTPEAVIVANCRAKTARSLSVVRPEKPGMVICMLSRAPCAVIDSGVPPCWRSIWAAAVSLDASIVPFARLPPCSMTS